MTIEVERLADAAEWNALVDRNPQATPFHRFEFLSVAAEHSSATLYPYVGYKGQEPVGLFPMFEVKKGPVTAALSPPPDLKITYLGPALMNVEKLSRRKRDRRNRRFVGACLEAIEAAIDPKFVHLRTGYRYDDPRPFLWEEFDPTPRYTYVVDITRDAEDLLQSFSSDARKNVRTDLEYEIETGGVEDAKRLIERIQRRHEEQDVDYGVTTAFVADLQRRLPPGTIHTYVCRHRGDPVGGQIILEDEETLYCWQSGADHDVDLPVTDLLDWRAIEDGKERDRSEYDLVGANDPRLCRYKAKFAPELREYTALRNGSRGVSAAASLYDRLR